LRLIYTFVFKSFFLEEKTELKDEGVNDNNCKALKLVKEKKIKIIIIKQRNKCIFDRILNFF
jgi:hypothetical protein